LSALDFLYEVLLEIRESKNYDEVLKEEIEEVIHDVSLNEKHDCNDIAINYINVNCANNMRTPKLGDRTFVAVLGNADEADRDIARLLAGPGGTSLHPRRRELVAMTG
jgi:hypothetical protein